MATHNATGEKVAIKILEKEKIIDTIDIKRVNNEISILKSVCHPHIIQLYEIVETHGNLYMVIEYANKGELFNYIVKKKHLEEIEARKFFQEILAGVEYLHESNIVHSDLKPENFFLDNSRSI